MYKTTSSAETLTFARGGFAVYAGKGRDLRRQHLETRRARQRHHAPAAAARPAGRQVRPRRADRGQSAARAVRHPALFLPRGEHRRSLSGRVHRSYQGHRQLRRRGARRALFHLRRADDRRGDPPVSARQQRPARIAQRARYRVQNSARSSPPRPAASRPRRRSQPLSASPGRRSLSRSTRSATP